MEWNVYRYNMNSGEVEPYNVFWHDGFVRSVRKIAKKVSTQDEFTVLLRHEVMYYFWCKAEWEVYVLPMLKLGTDKWVKIDAFDQLKLVWDHFADYCWEEFVRNGG